MGPNHRGQTYHTQRVFPCITSYTATQADIDAGANLVNTAGHYPGAGPNHRYSYHASSQTPLTIAKTQITGPNPVTTAGQV
ncbi:MAG: hypothetical protein IPP37_21570 [Saprospiraceae bacterium]|nr:hypothetical protein [Saprospiraceae bacterium]